MIRNKATKEKIARGFNAAAATYDQWADVQRVAAKTVADMVGSSFAPTQVLEIGCGTGVLTEYLMQQYPTTTLIATDIAFSMLKHSQQRFPKNNILWMAMDGEALAMMPQVDLIASSMTFHWYADFFKGLRQAYDQLAPGGKLAFSCLGKQSLKEWRDACVELKVGTPIPDLPCAIEMQELHPGLAVTVEKVVQHYDSPTHFLNTLKYIGATAARASYKPLSAGAMRRIVRHLEKVFPDKFPLTYEIIYGSWCKS